MYDIKETVTTVNMIASFISSAASDINATHFRYTRTLALFKPIFIQPLSQMVICHVCQAHAGSDLIEVHDHLYTNPVIQAAPTNGLIAAYPTVQLLGSTFSHELLQLLPRRAFGKLRSLHPVSQRVERVCDQLGNSRGPNSSCQCHHFRYLTPNAS